MAAEKKKTEREKKIVVRVLIGVAAFLLVEWCFIGWKFNFGPFKALGEIRLKGMPGNSDAYDFSKIEPMENSPLQSKTVLFLGSSVTNGAAALHQSIPEYFAARMGCTAIKEAVDGTTLCDTGKSSYIQRMLNNVDPDQQIDLVVCQLSTNDASRGCRWGISAMIPPPSPGAIEYIIRYAKGRGTARWCSTRTPAMTATPTLPWSAACMKLPKKEDVGVLDLWSDDAFNSISEEQRALYMKDNIHPYKSGYRDWWGPELEKQLLAYLEQ